MIVRWDLDDMYLILPGVQLVYLGLWSVPKCWHQQCYYPLPPIFYMEVQGMLKAMDKKWGEMSIEKRDDSRETLPETINFDMKTTSLNEKWTENIRKTEVSKRVFAHTNVRTVVVYLAEVFETTSEFWFNSTKFTLFPSSLGGDWLKGIHVGSGRRLSREKPRVPSGVILWIPGRLLQYFDFDSKTWMNIHIVITYNNHIINLKFCAYT